MITFEHLSALFIPIISITSGYLIGRYQHLFLEQRSRLTTRFEKLYLPFENLYFTKTLGAFHFTDLDLDLKNSFLEILFDNKVYADSKLHILILELKWLLDPEIYDADDINNKFYELSVHISDQYNRIAKQLYYKIPKL